MDGRQKDVFGDVSIKSCLQLKQTKPKYYTECSGPKQKSLIGNKDGSIIAQSKSSDLLHPFRRTSTPMLDFSFGAYFHVPNRQIHVYVASFTMLIFLTKAKL